MLWEYLAPAAENTSEGPSHIDSAPLSCNFAFVLGLLDHVY